MMPRPLFMFLTTAGGAAIAAVTEVADHAMSSNEIELIGFVAAGVFAVVSAVTWIDRRIDRKLADQKLLADAKWTEHNRLDRLRHQQIRRDMRYTAELLAARFRTPLRPDEPDVDPEEDYPSEPQNP